MPSKVGVLGVAVLTAVAFALRLAGFDQSIYGDEHLLYNIVEGRGLGGVLDVVSETEKTPPFHFLLAWGAGHLGDPTVLTRLPSLIFGVATVPLVYLLGLRTVGRNAGFVAAGIVAIAPFSIFYGIENRAYATLTFFSAMSTLALLSALRGNRPLSWLAYGASVAAVVYTHYTGVFVVLAQLGWALWTYRDRVRQLLLVNAAVALAFLPWLPGFLTQHDHSSSEAARLATRWPLSVETVVEMFTHALPGYPFIPLSELPGDLVVAAVWGTIGIALIAAVVRLVQSRRAGRGTAPAPTSILIFLLALVTPLGIALYSAQPDTSFLLSRNLSASVPALALLVGLLVTSLPRPFAVVAAGVVLAGCGIGAAKTLDVDLRRPPYRQASQFIDERARPGDAIINRPITVFSRSAADPAYDLGLYFDRKHEVFTPVSDDVWSRAAHKRSVFVVSPWVRGHFAPLSGPGERFVLREEKIFRGTLKIAVARYAGELQGVLSGTKGQETISWSLGDGVQIVPGATSGFLESISTSPSSGTTFGGWAIDAKRRRPADWVLLFNGRRLVAAGQPTNTREDVAKDYGRTAAVSGFTLAAPAATGIDASALRAFALVGNRASELPLTGTASELVTQP